MSQRGKGSTTLGQAAGKGKGPAKRHAFVRSRDRVCWQKLSTNDYKRIARRAGVKRMAHLMYSTAGNALEKFLHRIIEDSVNITEGSSHKTISKETICYSLERNGHKLYLS